MLQFELKFWIKNEIFLYISTSCEKTVVFQYYVGPQHNIEKQHLSSSKQIHWNRGCILDTLELEHLPPWWLLATLGVNFDNN